MKNTLSCTLFIKAFVNDKALLVNHKKHFQKRDSAYDGNKNLSEVKRYQLHVLLDNIENKGLRVLYTLPALSLFSRVF